MLGPREDERQLAWAHLGGPGRPFSAVAVATLVWHLLYARYCGQCAAIYPSPQLLPDLLKVSLPRTLPGLSDCKARLTCVIHTCSGVQIGDWMGNAVEL